MSLPNQTPTQIDWVNVGVALSSLLVSISSVVISSYLLAKHRKELSLSEQIANAPEFLYKEYINRELEKPIIMNGEHYKKLREARNAFTDRLKKQDGLKRGMTEGEAWTDFTYQLSIALQNLGLMILAGAIPIKLVLPNVAGLIVEDWNRCSEVVEARRNKPICLRSRKKLSAPIYFQRRHAEWLASAAKIYLHNYFEGAGLDSLLVSSEDFEKLEKRERELREAEPNLVFGKTSKEIENFLYAQS